MRITHICLLGPVTDGWNYQENLLSKYHCKAGHEVSLIASKWIWGTNGKMIRDERSRYINEDGVRIIRLEMYGKDDFSKRFKRFKNLSVEIEKTNPDVLFIHGVAFVDTKVLAKFLSKHPNIVVYADNHADTSNSATNWVSRNILHKVIWKHYARVLLPYVKKYYGVLPIRVDFLSEMYGIPKEKCELLVLGADDDLVNKANDRSVINATRGKYGIKEDDFLIMTGGKIDAWKTQTILLMEAVRDINRSNVKLIVFGSVEDSLMERVRSLVDGKRIQYIGWVDAKKTYELFASSDLVVFPGRHSVFWEQVVAQGVPIVVKDWPGTHHIDLGGNAHFLSEESPSAIQTVITEILNNPEEYERMKLIAKEKGMKEFSYKFIAERSLS